ncbi:MAG TPA: AAA family ATPase [Micromonosporaceae bacterium]|nr:AAA family ATPase [Micromonosporaceae bacterium]
MAGESAGLGDFIGRVRELDLLDDALAATQAGAGALVLVTGEPGVGKTRFCRQVARRARRRKLLVAWGTCWPESGAPPLWPWQTILPALGEENAAGLFVEDTVGAMVDPERFARFSAITDRLVSACTRSPALVVIDDVYAADAGAVLLTRIVARSLARLALLLLLTTRDEEVGRLHSTWDVEREAKVIRLSRFDLAETAAFLRAYGESTTDQALVRAWYRLTGGHPLHLHRLMTLRPASADADLPPSGVRGAIAEAVNSVPPEVRRQLRAAAVLGFSVDVREASVAAERTPVDVQAAAVQASGAGLVSIDGVHHFSFSHQLVREVLLDQLTVAERTEIHARAADLLAASASGAPDRLARGARHAVQAASLSADRARAAVAACRAAATALVRGFGYEQAAHLLADAVTMHERAGLIDRLTPVLVDWAEALLRCGHLAEARRVFDRAAMQADAENDAVYLARAALGLAGVWLNEHRTQLDWQRVVGLQRRALAHLPDDEALLRHRLVVRLAAEDVYRGGSVEPVLAALDQARRLGDGLVLAEALSLAHHALLTAEHTHDRLPIADELMSVASAVGEGMLALIGLCWRTVDLFHVGDHRAVRSLEELRERADALGCKSVLYVAEAMEVMLLVRAGRLDDAEARAADCFQLGNEVGDVDALGYLGAHLITIRWLQGRDAETLAMIEQIVDSPTLNPAEFGFQATVASIAARAGLRDRARDILDRLTCGGLAALPQSSTWLAGMLAIVEAARRLGDADVAAQVYDLLLPYADLPIMPSLAVTCFGSAHRALGLAATTKGDDVSAVAHLERALHANRLLGNRPFTAITMADLADALVRRGRRGDRDHAAGLLQRARAEADDMGMTAWSEAWRERLQHLVRREGTIERRHRQWSLTLGDRQAVVPDRLGVRYLAQILTSPGRAIGALELAGGSQAVALATPGGQPVLDARARAAYRQRVTELTDRITAAEDAGDDDTVRRLRPELEALFDELRAATGRGGRVRGFPDPGERARTAVRKAIKRAIEEITVADPVIGAHLAATVATGATCSYIPDPGQTVSWSLVDRR